MAADRFTALTVYWSAGGNTREVAEALHRTLVGAGAEADKFEIEPELEVDYADYALVLLGAPVYRFLPPEPVRQFLGRQLGSSEVRSAAPERPGHFAAVFCTYSGPHTGVREAIPALKYMGQFLEHAGIPVLAEWPVVGRFHSSRRQHLNVEGRLGDIRERPNEADLKDVCGRLTGLIRRLGGKLPRT